MPGLIGIFDTYTKKDPSRTRTIRYMMATVAYVYVINVIYGRFRMSGMLAWQMGRKLARTPVNATAPTCATTAYCTVSELMPCEVCTECTRIKETRSERSHGQGRPQRGLESSRIVHKWIQLDKGRKTGI